MCQSYIVYRVYRSIALLPLGKGHGAACSRRERVLGDFSQCIFLLFSFPPCGGRGHVKLCPLRRRSRGERSGWGEIGLACGLRPRFTPTLALPHQGGG